MLDLCWICKIYPLVSRGKSEIYQRCSSPEPGISELFPRAHLSFGSTSASAHKGPKSLQVASPAGDHRQAELPAGATVPKLQLLRACIYTTVPCTVEGEGALSQCPQYALLAVCTGMSKPVQVYRKGKFPAPTPLWVRAPQLARKGMEKKLKDWERFCRDRALRGAEQTAKCVKCEPDESFPTLTSL